MGPPTLPCMPDPQRLRLYRGRKATISRSMASFFRDLSAGLHGRCPACSEGRMFRAFLKVVDSCPECGEELHHHRADDFPAYIVVAIVGHVMLSMAYWIEVLLKP